MSFKDRFKNALKNVRKPEGEEDDKAFLKNLGLMRLLFFLPFLIIAIFLMIKALS